MSRPRPRPVKPHCTCECPFGCVVHDANLDDLISLDEYPPHVAVLALRKANAVIKNLQAADGEVYVVPCEIADELDAALRMLAEKRWS